MNFPIIKYNSFVLTSFVFYSTPTVIFKITNISLFNPLTIFTLLSMPLLLNLFKKVCAYNYIVIFLLIISFTYSIILVSPPENMLKYVTPLVIAFCIFPLILTSFEYSPDFTKKCFKLYSVVNFLVLSYLALFRVDIYLDRELMNYMTFGYWLLPSVITFFYFSIVGRSKIYLFLSLISFFVLFSFGSRFSLVIAISSLFVFDNLNSNFNFKKIAFLIFGGLVAFVFYLNILTIVTILLNILEPLGIAPTSLYRLLKMASDTSGSIIASSERESLYHLSLNLIGDNPFGYSILGYSNLLDSTSIFKYPHNIFIQLILEKGIILSTFITCAWFIIYKRAMRVFSYGDRFFLVMLTLISTKLLVSSNYLWEPAFWILCGCLVKSMSMRGSNGEDSIIFNR